MRKFGLLSIVMSCMTAATAGAMELIPIVPGESGFLWQDGSQGSAESLEQARIDWSKAQTVQVTLSNFDFTPRDLRFRKGVPYRLVLRNISRRGHDFSSPRFFASILLRGAGQQLVRANYTRINLRGMEQAEIFFIAQSSGRYRLVCTHFGHSALGMRGTITVTSQTSQAPAYEQ